MSAVLRGNLRMALSGVRGSKWRSFLTVLGVVTGIVAVVTVVGIGEGVKRQIAGTLNHFGKDLIIVRPPGVSENGSPADISKTDVLFGMTSTIGLSTADAEIVKKASGVSLSTPLGLVPGEVRVNEDVKKQTMVLSASADVASVLNQAVAYGDLWTSEQDDGHFAVLGRKAAETLFEEPVPLGKSFTFRGQTFQVRGVFAPFANVPFSPTANFDNAVFIPYKSAAQVTNDSADLYAILAKPTAAEGLNGAVGSIRKDLAAAHGGEQDFQVLKSSETLAAGSETIRLLSAWILAVAAISLLMGGVGIMNIMLLVVAERMHEIGVRKAIGASGRQILGQFILEATVISLIGGVVGIGLSAGVIGLLRVYTDLHPIISWTAVGVGAGVSVAIGIVFGAVPAIKAARKDPIEALRHE